MINLGAGTDSGTLQSINRRFSENDDLTLETGYVKVAQTTEATSFSGFYFDDGAALWLTKNAVNGSVSHIPAARSFRMTIGSGATDAITRQTLRIFPYFAGNIESLSFGLLWNLQDGAVLESGYGDDNNGIFFSVAKTAGVYSVSLVKRSDASGSIVNTSIPQSDWNIDKLDGTGFSGITLDLTKGQMFCVDWTWYGFGSITWAFRINGKNHLCHRMLGGNSLTEPLLGEPNQPLRHKIYNSGATAGSSYIQVAGIDLRSEGVDPSQRSSFARSTPFPVASKTVNINNTAVLMSVRPKITFKGRNNRGNVKLTRVWISGTGSGSYALVYNPTLTGASFVDVDASNSFCDYDVTASAYTGGIVIYSGAFSASTLTEFFVPSTTDPLAPYSDFSATNTVSLVFRATANSVVQCGINWEEFI